MPPSHILVVEESNADLSRADLAPARQKPRRKRAMVWVRKTHMYLGLVLFPWVIFFGVSGILFNHPGIGEQVRARPLSPAVLRDEAALLPFDAAQAARDVVTRLGEQGAHYRVDESFSPHLHGSTAFASAAAGEKHLVLLHLPSARGVILTRADQSPPAAPFSGTLPMPAQGFHSLAARLAQVLPSVGISSPEAQALSLRIAPTLRFRMFDEREQPWNVTYDLGSGQLDGRPSRREAALSLHDLLGAMHKTHHFPPETGPTTFWALFADVTGLTLILWALTGLLMWWQLKRTRALGVIVVSVGLLVAALTMLGTHEELRFGNVQPEEPGAPRSAPPGTKP
jgi:hypothetical protein